MFRNFAVKSFAVAALLSMNLLNAGQPEKNSFKETTSLLDAGGPFYLYYSSERIVASLDEKINAVRDLCIASLPQGEAAQKELIAKYFSFASNLMKGSGVSEISGAGASSISREGDLYSNKFFMHHYKEKNKGLLWRLFGAAPHSLNDELGLLPADTAYGEFFDFDARLLWNFLKSESEKSGIDKLKKVFADFETTLKNKDVDLEKLLESCDGRFGQIVTLKPDRMSVIPVGINKFVQIPQPGIALFIKVKDDYLFEILKKKLSRFIPPPASGAVQPDPNDKKIIIAFPLPLPLPFSPVIVQENGYLIIASNSELLDSIRSAGKNASGLISTPEFKALSAGTPDSGNGFKFVSERFTRTLTDIQFGIMRTPTGEGTAAAEAMRRLNPMSNLKVYGIWQVRDDGIFTTFNSNLSVGDILVLQCAVVPTAIVSGMLLPALSSAREKARRINCMSNLKQMGLALKQYSMDHNDKFPELDGAAGLEALRKNDYLSDYKVYTCPSSNTVRQGKAGQSLAEENVSYIYFGGFSEGENPDMPIAFDKPLDHSRFVNVLFVDGHVQGYIGFFKNCTDVVNMLKSRNNYSVDDLKRLDEKAAKLGAQINK
ncbi:MAG: hypothetical protein A2020_16290 [Lentisphaerae bacterium GWF2_45_14]|nr:MAG: hypothetical protein A2020_16290 [Lentisphaerae bacterium GWF2_45_14]